MRGAEPINVLGFVLGFIGFLILILLSLVFITGVRGQDQGSLTLSFVNSFNLNSLVPVKPCYDPVVTFIDEPVSLSDVGKAFITVKFCNEGGFDQVVNVSLVVSSFGGTQVNSSTNCFNELFVPANGESVSYLNCTVPIYKGCRGEAVFSVRNDLVKGESETPLYEYGSSDYCFVKPLNAFASNIFLNYSDPDNVFLLTNVFNRFDERTVNLSFYLNDFYKQVPDCSVSTVLLENSEVSVVCNLSRSGYPYSVLSGGETNVFLRLLDDSQYSGDDFASQEFPVVVKFINVSVDPNGFGYDLSSNNFSFTVVNNGDFNESVAYDFFVNKVDCLSCKIFKSRVCSGVVKVSGGDSKVVGCVLSDDFVVLSGCGGSGSALAVISVDGQVATVFDKGESVSGLSGLCFAPKFKDLVVKRFETP